MIPMKLMAVPLVVACSHYMTQLFLDTAHAMSEIEASAVHREPVGCRGRRPLLMLKFSDGFFLNAPGAVLVGDATGS